MLISIRKLQDQNFILKLSDNIKLDIKSILLIIKVVFKSNMVSSKNYMFINHLCQV